jgi:hypothetical protein
MAQSHTRNEIDVLIERDVLFDDTTSADMHTRPNDSTITNDRERTDVS